MKPTDEVPRSKVKTAPTFCECGAGSMHGPIKVLQSDLREKLKDPRIFFVGDTCQFTPETDDELIGGRLKLGYEIYRSAEHPMG